MCHAHVLKPGRNRADAVSIGTILAPFWSFQHHGNITFTKLSEITLSENISKLVTYR